MSGTDSAAEDIRVRRDEVASRFEILVGDVVAGYAEYRDEAATGGEAGVRAFPHTVVDPEFGGRGLAGRMIGEALKETKDAGLRVRPECSFVAKYVDKHPESAVLA